jgi:hypothetical protein
MIRKIVRSFKSILIFIRTVYKQFFPFSFLVSNSFTLQPTLSWMFAVPYFILKLK